MTGETETQLKDLYDVAIVGGGLAGGAAAAALGDAGFSCVLIDAEAPTAMQDDAFDGRTSAIAFACGRMFQRIGVWEDLADEAEPIRDILVTDGAIGSPSQTGNVSASHLHFDSKELPDGSPLGWIIENRLLRRAIYRRIESLDSVDVFAPALCHGARAGDRYSEIDLGRGKSLKAKLIVAADGKRSRLAAAAEIKTLRWSYAQAGIVVTVGHERPHEGVAQEYFLPSGPFAILPMANNRSSIVWTEKQDAARAFLAMDDDDFLAALAARFGDYLGELHLASPRWSYPLGLSFATTFFAPRLALIGDAARAIHPIAGQGYNLGLKDIAALVDTLKEARGVGLDIGDQGVLSRYDQWRRFDSTALALSTDVINRLFFQRHCAIAHRPSFWPRCGQCSGTSEKYFHARIRRRLRRIAEFVGALVGASPSLRRTPYW